MSERRARIHTEHELPKTRRCELLDVARSSAYYHPDPVSEADLALMRLIDEIHLKRPFYGSRRMRDELEDCGHTVNRKRVQRLMRQMDLRALYPRHRTSQPGKGHKIYPYLLRDLAIERSNQVWATDITFIPMTKGFMYLVAIMDWYSRHVMAWRLSNTLDADFCVEALEDAISKGKPEVFNTDQGSQFTSEDFTGLLKQHGVRISMDGKGTVHGQHIRRTALAHREIRRGLLEGLFQRTGGQGRDRQLHPLLQYPEAPSGFGLPDTGPGVQRRLGAADSTNNSQEDVTNPSIARPCEDCGTLTESCPKSVLLMGSTLVEPLNGASGICYIGLPS